MQTPVAIKLPPSELSRDTLILRADEAFNVGVIERSTQALDTALLEA